MRVPRRVQELNKKVNEAKLLLEQQNKKKPKVNEIAEYINVTEQHLIKAISNYRKRYGIFTESENHFIYFEPYLKIEKKDNLFDYLIIC